MFIFEPIIFLISYIFPKANKVILFGAWAGKSVSDNSKYLFEYFLDYESDSYECYFVTKNKSTISQVDADYRDNVLYAYSLKGIYYQLRAKTYVYSSGYSDFIRAMITRRNTKVNLWHGVPLKKIGFDDSHHQPKGLSKNLRNLRNIVFPYTSNRCDYIVSHNEGMSKVYESAFLPNKGVIISGQPRVDGLFKSQEGKKELFNGEYDYIVYTPTFRDSGENDFLSTEDLFLINKFCICNGYKFLIKLHPSLQGSLILLDDFDAIIDITKSNFDLYKDILPNTKILITDYSSIMFDFFLHNESLILFSPDVQRYLDTSREMYFEYNSICHQSYCTSWSAVLFQIKNSNFVNVNNKYPLWSQSGQLGHFSSGLANKLKKVL